MKKKGSNLFSFLFLATMMLIVVSSCSVNKTGKAFSWDAGVDQNIYNLAALASSGKAGTFSFVADTTSDIAALSPLTAALGVDETLRSSEVTTQKDLIIAAGDSSLASGEAIMTLDISDGTKLTISSSSSKGTTNAVNALLDFKNNPQLKSKKVKVLADGTVQDLTGTAPAPCSIVTEPTCVAGKNYYKVGSVDANGCKIAGTCESCPPVAEPDCLEGATYKPGGKDANGCQLGGTCVAAVPIVGNTGVLKVTSDPAGAEVYVNDVKKGNTPFTMESVVAGDYKVQVKLSGYKDSEIKTATVGVQETDVDFKLEKVCTPDFSDARLCTLTACGSDGKQIKTCQDKNNCGGAAQVSSVSCTFIAPCTPDWKVRSTGECQPNGAQTVTYVDANVCDPSKSTKTESQACKYTAPCQTTWTVLSEDSCDAATQTKKITLVDSCNANNKKTEIQSCAYICTEKDWTCVGSIDAAGCKYDELLTRTCTSTVKVCSESNTAKPTETYKCIPKCFENWQSTPTEDCRSDGNQGITWTDKNSCGTTHKKPVENAQKCTYTSTQGTILLKTYDGAKISYEKISYEVSEARTPKKEITPLISGKEGLIDYVLPNLDPGTYEIVVELDGYESDTRNVLVEKGKTTDAGEIKLTPQISTAFKNIKDKKEFDSYNIVIGAAADPSDNIGALDIAGGHRISKTVLDTQVDSTKNLIIVGGPCANSESGRLLGKPWKDGKAAVNCAEGFEDGKGFVQIFKEGDTIKIIMAGYSAVDTRRLAKVIKRLVDNADKFKGKKIEVCGEDLNDVRYDCQQFKLNTAKRSCLKAKGQWTGDTCQCPGELQWKEEACIEKPACVPDYSDCTTTACVSGKQTKTCNDKNKCEGSAAQTTELACSVATGTLTVTAVKTGTTTAVTGAAIIVDGQLRTEVTPATITLTLGPHTVKLTKIGYEDSAENSTEVKEGQNSLKMLIKKKASTPPPPPPPPQ